MIEFEQSGSVKIIQKVVWAGFKLVLVDFTDWNGYAPITIIKVKPIDRGVK